MSISVKQVETRRELRQFIELPRHLYEGTPWAPPIWMDERSAYNRENNPILDNSDFELFIALRGGVCVGRILAYVDHSWNSHFKAEDGLFGALDAGDDEELFRLLIETASRWLKSKGARRILGPIHPVAEFWGTLVSGFDTTPVFLTPWNPPFADAHIRAAGLKKEMDLNAYEADSGRGYRLPDRYINFYERFLKRHPDITLRPLSMKHFMRDAEHIWRITDVSLLQNWGYVPVPRDVFMDMVKRLKLIVDPGAVWFVEKGGKPVGYALGYPDINLILRDIKGRLLPLGWLKLLFSRKRLKDYRLFGLGVLPEFHGLGLDALMYVHLARELGRRGIRLEANWILENNVPMNNALVRLGLEKIKLYRIYTADLNGRLN